MKRRFSSLVYAMLLLLLIHAPSLAAAVSGAPYEINAIIPVTGSGAFLGKSYQEAFRALEVATNATGGIGGRPLKFVIGDSQTSPQTGLQLVNNVISKHVAAFIDGGPSTVCLSSAPIVATTGPVDYCLSPVIHPARGTYVFSASISSDDLAKVAARYFRERGWTRIAMISSIDATGEDMERQTDAALRRSENRSMALVDREHFNTLDFSVAAQIARIKNAHPQAVLAWTSGTPLGTVLRDVQSAGLDLPLLTSNGNMTYAQMNAYANSLPKDFFFPALLAMTSDSTSKGPLHDAQVAYAQAFKAIGVRPDEGHVLVWDPAMILISALRHIGPDATATQIRNYILQLHGWVGVDGVYDFSVWAPG